MAKEYCWDVTLEGEAHQLICTYIGNKYELWVDDEYLTAVYRRSMRQMHFGLEEEVELFGIKCLFVVWDERPDFVINGVMLGKDTDYLQAREKRKQTACKGFRIMFWIGVLILCSAPVIAILLPQIEHASKWVRAAIGGILLMIAGSRYKRKWAQW